MSNKEIQNINNTSTPNYTGYLLKDTANLPEESQNALREYAAKKQIDSEFDIMDAKLKEATSVSDIQKHLYARKEMQMDSFTKGADKITTNIETPSGNMKIESRSGNCYVATATYQDAFHPNVVLLRDFRDRYLHKSLLGRLFIKFYYTFGPYAAYLPAHFTSVRNLSKSIIDSLVIKIRERYY